MAIFYPINSPLINYFFYPVPLLQNGPNVPLAGGFLFFFADENHSLQLPTYSDVFDPDNPVVNPNPLPLGAAGEWPLFYLENRFYYIVITDSSGDIDNPITTISHYNPANGTGTIVDDGSNNNLITNGQFSYPITFWKTTDEPTNTGLITKEKTGIAWGWEFFQDPTTTSKNKITFAPINNEDVEGNPIYEVVLNSIANGTEEVKDFRSIIGSVNFRQGAPVTIALQLQSLLAGSPIVNVLLERNFGEGGTVLPPLPPVATFTINSVRAKYTQTFTIPALSGETIGPGNFLAIRIQMALSQSCQIALTNAQLLAGSFTSAQMIYTEEAVGDAKSQILGTTTQIEDAGLAQNYSNYRYKDGIIFPYAYTAYTFLFPKFAAPSLADAVVCNNASYSVNAYNAQGIPYRRLYQKIGNTFGGSGDLEVSAQDNVVTFQSGVGAIENNPYSAQTSGFTVANPVPGLKMGIDCVLTGDAQVTATWTDNFAPDQIPQPRFIGAPPDGLMGYWVWPPPPQIPQNQITLATVNPGSGIAQAVAQINFNTTDVTAYETTGGIGVDASVSYLEFAAFTNNTRGHQPNFVDLIMFSVDGKIDTNLLTASHASVIVPFISTETLTSNLNTFVRTVANPFQWTVTVTALPSASTYFFYSSATVDYYGWFKVDGVGTDPAIGGRTGVEIDLSSLDSPPQIAAKIAAATNNLTFSVPADTDLPALVPNTADSLFNWYINL